MLWIAIGHVLFGITQVVENRLLSLGVSRSLVLPALSGALANVVASFLLIPGLGALGAGLAKTVAFGLNCILAALTLIRVSRERE
jgi:Na+-driven multidrug efflux pump